MSDPEDMPEVLVAPLRGLPPPFPHRHGVAPCSGRAAGGFPEWGDAGPRGEDLALPCTAPLPLHSYENPGAVSICPAFPGTEQAATGSRDPWRLPIRGERSVLTRDN